jgi:excisionase family DNA binding protein
MSIFERLASIDHAITVAELGELLSLGRTAIYDMVRRGAIPCIRIGYSVRFDPDEIAKWLRTRSSK